MIEISKHKSEILRTYMTKKAIGYVAECSGKVCKKRFSDILNGRILSKLLMLGDVAVVCML